MDVGITENDWKIHEILEIPEVPFLSSEIRKLNTREN